MQVFLSNKMLLDPGHTLATWALLQAPSPESLEQVMWTSNDFEKIDRN